MPSHARIWVLVSLHENAKLIWKDYCKTKIYQNDMQYHLPNITNEINSEVNKNKYLYIIKLSDCKYRQIIHRLYHASH